MTTQNKKRFKIIGLIALGIGFIKLLWVLYIKYKNGKGTIEKNHHTAGSDTVKIDYSKVGEKIGDSLKGIFDKIDQQKKIEEQKYYASPANLIMTA